MQYFSIRAVAARLKSQFKVDMDMFELVQACADALKKMGYIALQRSVYQAQVTNYCINMPGNVWKVRGAVRLDQPVVGDGMTIVTDDVYYPPQLIFKYDETSIANNEIKLLKDNYIPAFKGPFIDFVWDCPCVKFNETDIQVALEVTEIKLDDEKFPMVPEPAFYGCLYYALYVYYQPLFLLKQTDGQTMQMVEQWKERNMAQANQSMTMESLTANERDNLFNIMTSMDRKVFGLPA